MTNSRSLPRHLTAMLSMSSMSPHWKDNGSLRTMPRLLAYNLKALLWVPPQPWSSIHGLMRHAIPVSTNRLLRPPQLVYMTSQERYNVDALEVVLADLKCGNGHGMRATLPDDLGWLPTITTPHYTCVKMMKLFTSPDVELTEGEKGI